VVEYVVRDVRGLTVGHLQAVGSRFEREMLGEHVLSMLSFALSQRGVVPDAESVSTRDRELHARMRRWIRDNYPDPDLSAARLAADFNVSVRYMHKVFASAGQGATFLSVVQRERLEAAVRMLRTAACARMFIAQIAYRYGFSDPRTSGWCSARDSGSRRARLRAQRRTQQRGGIARGRLGTLASADRVGAKAHTRRRVLSMYFVLLLLRFSFFISLRASFSRHSDGYVATAA
jgi:AraC-like DNA-binding protein